MITRRAVGTIMENKLNDVRILIGADTFLGRFQDHQAPKTCSKFRSLLPYVDRIIHVRWSGESCWIPLGDLDLGLEPENATSFPKLGEILLYPGKLSEAEILLPYGAVCFASKAGQLAGSPLINISENLGRLAEIGREVLYQGAREIRFEAL